MRASLTCRLVAFLLSMAATPVSAQTTGTLTGTLTRAIDGQPAEGVVVAVRIVGDSAIAARALTGPSGRFVVTVHADSLVVQALRVGQRPQEIAVLRLRAGETSRVEATLEDVPVRLTALDTRAATRCQVRPDGATRVAQLFDAARTALVASQLVALDSVESPVSWYHLGVQRLDTRERRVGEEVVEERRDSSLTPFRTSAPDTLAAEGFRTVAVDGSLAWRGPDAAVLTADSFLSGYCLRTADDSESAANDSLVGVTFEPAQPRRGVVDIRGTLWLDASTYALRHIEYVYVGAEPVMSRARPGGRVDYARLENGVWFVRRWEIRSPVVEGAVRRSPFSSEFVGGRLTGILRTRGEVQEMRAGGRTVFQAAESGDAR